MLSVGAKYLSFECGNLIFRDSLNFFNMSEKRRKEFYAWHKEKVESNAVFDFQKELSVYLHSDVEVLAQSLEAFAEEMVELTGINPVIECVTIASTANKVWRKNFLIRDLIALEPKNGWRQNQQNQSVEALQWLEYENSKMNGEIQVRGLTCVKSMQIKISLAAFYRIFCFAKGSKLCIRVGTLLFKFSSDLYGKCAVKVCI